MTNRIILIVSLLLVFISCESDDSYKNLDIDYVPAKANVNLDFDSGIVVDENSQPTLPFTVTLDSAVDFDVHFHVLVNAESTATLGEDFSIPEEVIINAGDTSVTEHITILNDCAIEEQELVSITIGDDYFVNVNVDPVEAKVNIDNYVAPGLDLTIEWDDIVPFTVDGTTVNISTCDIADMDLLIYNESGNDTGVYDAATGACPEKIYLDPSLFSDGEYSLILNDYGYTTIFDDADITGLDYDFDFKIKVNRCGADDTVNGVTVVEDVFNLSNGSGSTYLLATFVVENGVVSNLTFVE